MDAWEHSTEVYGNISRWINLFTNTYMHLCVVIRTYIRLPESFHPLPCFVMLDMLPHRTVGEGEDEARMTSDSQRDHLTDKTREGNYLVSTMILNGKKGRVR